jgi:hypothetical protein
MDDKTIEITSGALNLLRLAARGQAEDGWAPVSEKVWPMLALVPSQLLERERLDGGGRCRITEHGRIMLAYRVVARPPNSRERDAIQHEIDSQGARL